MKDINVKTVYTRVMTYKNVEIGVPTIGQIKEFTAKQGYKYNPIDCYVWLKAKDWKTNQGKSFGSLEFACVIYNGVYIFAKRKSKEKINEKQFKTLSYEGSPYKEQLLDKRWRLFREFAIVARGGMCENCGSKKNLVIHHPQYKNGYNAWDYSVKDVVCLCDACHSKLHGIKK